MYWIVDLLYVLLELYSVFDCGVVFFIVVVWVVLLVVFCVEVVIGGIGMFKGVCVLVVDNDFDVLDVMW